MQQRSIRVILCACGALSCTAFTAVSSRADATLTPLISFGSPDGRSPYGDLLPDGAGNFYGTTQGGGDFELGTVFKFEVATNKLTTLGSFDGASGSYCYAGVIADSAGNLYGTTLFGANRAGSIFKLDAGTNDLSAIYSFSGPDGRLLLSPLLLRPDGLLYGTTFQGGDNAIGTVFSLDPATGELTTLVTFDGTNGSYPLAGLVADAAGNLYSTTSGNSGANNRGTVFRIDGVTHELSTLATFTGDNGAEPFCSLIFDAAGNIYGTTKDGGPSDLGTVFKIEAGTNNLITLASFHGTTGANPYQHLLMDAAGNFFGTTHYGGVSNVGTVFKVAAGTNELSALASFGGADGESPFAGLIADADGVLYGVTGTGGDNGYGTIFKVTGSGFVVSTSCVGDLNNDGIVDLTDLATQLAHYGEVSAPPEDGDLNGDGVIDLTDLAALLAAYGRAC